MKGHIHGIPVHRNGDPVRTTIVFAQNFQHFRMWCSYSRVNPRSRKVVWGCGGSDHALRGWDRSELDVVFYNDWYAHLRPGLEAECLWWFDMWNALSAYGMVYNQGEAYLIEPTIVD